MEIENISAVVNQYYELVKIVPCDKVWKDRAAKAVDELCNLRENSFPSVRDLDAEKIAKAVWIHAQKRPLSWTLESMKRIITKTIRGNKCR